MGLHDHPRLEHADADTLLLGCLERTKQRLAYKLGSHAAAIVSDREDGVVIPALGGDGDAALCANGFLGVAEQVGHDAAELSTIGIKAVAELQISLHGDFARTK